MRHLTTRRVLKWAAVPLIVTQVGCAARGVRVPPVDAQATITEADQKARDEYVRKQKTKSVAGLSILGVVALPVSVGLAGLSVATLNLEGVQILQASPAIFQEVAKNAKTNETTRETARRQCLEPRRLEQALGPDHPDLAESLAALAHGYAAIGDPARAEPLYQRALTIQERALGSDHPNVARTLDGYAALLRTARREGEAALLEARARAIRDVAAAATPPQPDAAPDPGATPATSEPAALSEGTPSTPGPWE